MWYSMQDGLSVCSASGDFKILRALYMKCFKSKAGAADIIVQARKYGITKVVYFYQSQSLHHTCTFCPNFKTEYNSFYINF